MGRRKKAAAGTAVSSVESAKMRFEEDVQGARIESLHPATCFPMVIDRDRYRGGVEKMKRIFTASSCDGTNSGHHNISAGTGASVVVPVTDSYKPYLVKHLLSQGLNDDQVRTEMESDSVWYGIVDGCFTYWAIRELMEEQPSVWGSFKWSVLVLNTSPSMDRLRQMKRSYETNRRAENCIEVTLYDEYNRMYNEFVRLKGTSNKDPSSTKVAVAYDGGKHVATDSIAQKARTAIRLGHEVINELGLIMNKEHPELVVVDLPQNHPARKDPTKTSQYVDCRVFKGFISDASLKQASNFLNRDGPDGLEVQIHVLHRLRHLFRENGFRTNGFKVVVEQYTTCQRVLQQCRLFETFIGSTEWPAQLTNFRTKLLRGTQFDAAVMSIADNGDEILPTLIDEYKSFYPDEYARNLVMKQQSSLTDDTQDDTQINNANNNNEDIAAVDGGQPGQGETGDGDSPPPLVKPLSTGEPDDDKNKTEKLDSDKSTTAVETSEDQRTVEMLKNLAKVGIEVHNSTWDKYCTTTRGDDDQQFDFVLEDPPYGIPSNPSGAGANYDNHIPHKDFLAHSDHIHKMLRHGGYVFIFTSLVYSESWKRALRATGFTVWGGLFIMVKSLVGRQMRRKGMFPQSFTEFAVVARKPGKRTDNFQPDFSSPYEFVKCRLPRRLGVIDEVPLARPKLKDTKSTTDKDGHVKKPKALRVEEKDVGFLMDIMKTFCPSGGSIFDGYGGTLTVAIAAMKTGRRCVVVEKDPHCFRIAAKRLVEKFTELYKDMLHSTTPDISVLPEIKLREAVSRSVDQEDITAADSHSDDDHDVGDDNGLPDESEDTNTADVFRSLQDIETNMALESTCTPGLASHSGMGTTSQRSDRRGHCGISSQVSGRQGGGEVNGSSCTETDGIARKDGHAEKLQRREESVLSLSNFYAASGKVSVHLFHNGCRVGTGNLAPAMDEDGQLSKEHLRRILHGHNLDQLDASFSNSVVVRRCLIDNDHKAKKFLGPHVGGDDPMSELGDITPHGFILWPSKDVVLP